MTGSWEEETLFSRKRRYIIWILALLLWIFLEKNLGLRPKVVVSGSMEPSLPVGSICLIAKKYPIEKIQEKDIIAFSMDGESWITHRVVEKLENYSFITKGDANKSADLAVVSADEYRGKNLAHLPYIGFISLFCFKNRMSVLAMIILGVVLTYYMKGSGAES